MADLKLSELTELAATPADTDYLYVQDVSEAGANQSKRISVANLIAAAPGGAGAGAEYAVTATNDANQSIPTSTWTTLSFNTDLYDSGAMHFTSNAALTGTVAKTATSATLAGTGTAFLTELAVGQVISVPGTAAEVRVVTAIASDTSLTVNLAFDNTASGQTATRVNSAFVSMAAGRYIPAATIQFQLNATGVRFLRILKNGDAVNFVAQAGPFPGNSTAPTRGVITAPPLNLAQYDYLQIQAWQNVGSSIDVQYVADYTPNFGMHLLTSGPAEPDGMASDTLWDAAGDVAYATGSDAATRLPIGTAGQVLTVNAGATAPEWDDPAASGAPVDAKYLTTATNGTLSAEIVIPGLAASADIAGAEGGGTSEEYDTATTGLAWAPSTPETVDSNTTILSHLYVAQTTGTERFGTKAWAPAGAFDARCKIIVAASTAAATSMGLFVNNSDNTSRLLMAVNAGATGGSTLQAFTFAASSYTQRGSTWTIPPGAVYLRTTRDGSNNVSFYFSADGNIWQFIATQSFTFTVANVGFRTSATANVQAAVDWLRTDV